MIVRPCARFGSTLPEDIFEDDQGNLTQPPGKSVADAIGELFCKLGCVLDYGPDQVLDIAWEFGFEKAGCRFRVGVNLVDDYWFFCENKSWIDKVFRRRPAVYLRLLEDLAQELEADPRFFNVRWYLDREDEARSAGASAPVDDGRQPRG